MLTLIAPLLAALLAAASVSPADEHLFAGARKFREGRFGEALVEFRVAGKLDVAGEAGWYAASCLVRLGRSEDAVEAFDEATQRAPSLRDDLFDYYNAVACHEARLYLCADRLLAGLGDRSGPRIREEALKLRSRVATVLDGEPSKATVDWYLARAKEARERRPRLAASYLREATGLAGRRPDRYRKAEADAALARAGVGR